MARHASDSVNLLTSLDGSEKFYCFWGPHTPGSNWFMERVRVDGFDYVCGEQRMMHAKAAVFGDEAVFSRVMQETEPKRIKELGRLVSGYEDKIWREEGVPMMVELAWSKAQQSERVSELVKAIGPGVSYVEASPYDKVWGIGLGEADPRARDRATWRGLNLLGKAWDQAAALHLSGAPCPQSGASKAILAMAMKLGVGPFAPGPLKGPKGP